MATTIGQDEGFAALDQELFGDMSSDENDNQPPHLDTTTKSIDHSLNHYDAAESKNPEAVLHPIPQVKTAPQSGRFTPPQSLPSTPVSHGGGQRPIVADSKNGASLDMAFTPCIAPAPSDSNQLVVENLSWMKTRIIDVHQLLLYYLNLRDAHHALATDFQKEAVLRAETQQALESIREQQDQTSEDFPKLQFQIAQLKLDYQKERATRVVAETNLANINEEIKAYAAGYGAMQTRVSDYEAKEVEWMKGKAELSAVVTSIRKESRIQPQISPPEESSLSQASTEAGHSETHPMPMQCE